MFHIVFGLKGPALRAESATSGISSIKQRSQLTQSKLTVVFVTHHHSNRVTKTTHVLLEMNASEIPPSLVNMYRGLKDKKVDFQIRWQIVRHARSYSIVAKKCLWEKYWTAYGDPEQ